MSLIYAISDIHGNNKALNNVLTKIDLSNKNNKLICLGDYIDRGKDSKSVLYKLMELDKNYPNQVVILMGNHDLWFLEFLNNPSKGVFLAFLKDIDYNITIKSLLDENQFNVFIQHIKHDGVRVAAKYAAQRIKDNHPYLIEWLESKHNNLYYETDNQIFVHDGVDESAQEFWSIVSNYKTYTMKQPVTTGYFYKDVISGHIASHQVAKDGTYFAKVYFDGKSHYFIDGMTNVSNIIPLLVYDTAKDEYYYA